MKKFLSLVASFATFVSVQAQSFFYTNSVAGNFTNTLSIDTNSFPLLLTGITVTVTNGQYLKFYDSSAGVNRYTNAAYSVNVMANGWQTNYYTNYWLGTSAGNLITNTVIGSNIARVFFATNYTTPAYSNELPRVVEAYFQPSAPGVATPSSIYGNWTFTRGVTVAAASNSQAIIQLQYTK